MRHFVVAGAGIGGLATALALSRINACVTVVERRAALAPYGAGIQLAPNATRILERLGLLHALKAVATEPDAVRIRRGRDGAELAVLPLGRAAITRYGAPFLLLHRAALQRVLMAAVEGHVAVAFGCDVAEADRDGDGVRVTVPGRDWHADGFVDARGWQGPVGTVRQTAWRALLPARHLPARYTEPNSNLWLGAKTHLVHYPIEGGTLINVVAVTEARAPAGFTDDPWSRPGSAADLRDAFAGWHDDALALLDPEADWRCWPLIDASAPVPRSHGPTTRVGDAARSMLPFLAQGASQAIEDAAALAASLTRHANVGTAFQAYCRERQPRAARVQRASRRQGDLYHLPRPAADARDIAMRLLGGAGSLRRLDWLYGRR